jgi:ribonuclease HI
MSSKKSSKKHVSRKIIDNINVYTDGSCMKKKDGMKCGYGVYFSGGELKNMSKPFVHEPLTNQRSELYAIYKALRVITKSFKFNTIHIYTDSEYSLKSLTVWINAWKKNNWKTAGKKEVLNQDIIKMIDDKILSKYKDKIIFTHVKAHTGKSDIHSLGNEQADKLATSGALDN